MKRFEYKVLKPFSIYKDSEGRKRIALTDDERKVGTTFNLSTKYVDYENKEDKIRQGSITKRLCKRQYLKLIREIDLSSNDPDKSE
jgi:hypothetical protein